MRETSAAPPARLGASLADRYRIERELGAGGMATVYLAHDLKHDRKVAIKVLRAELAAVIGAERFLKEIKTTAALQHPHILGLLDSGSDDGQVWYAMPFVAGESLRDRLQRETQLPIPEAVRIAAEVASALDYAHRQGVIHRDIKPENILLADGQALVADFGIALAASSGGRMTETGLSLGTPHYMSPEQAMGEREITPRADIFALGCVLHEMLIGEPPFTGPTAQAVVAKLMTEPPASLVARRPRVPPHIDDAVLTALEKLPADRFATAAEFAKALNDTGTRSSALGTRQRPHAERRGPGADRRVPIALAAGIALGIAAGAGWMVARREAPVMTGRIVRVTTDDGLEIQPAISPDGKVIAYAAGTSLRVRLFLRPVAGGRAVPLTSDSLAIQQDPRWSPSGGSILFRADGGVDTAAAGLGGGRAVTLIARGNGQIMTANWSPDGREVVFVRRDSMLIYTIATGQARFVAKQAAKECAWSPRNDLVACTVPRHFAEIGPQMGNTGPSTLTVTSVRGGEPIAITDSASLNISPVWAPDGRRLYFVSNRDGQRDIYYVGIGRDGRARGEIHRLTTALNAASLSLSGDGRRLAYSVYTPQANIWSVPIQPGVVATPAMATQVTFGHQLVEGMEVTPDGKTLVYDSDRNGNSDIWRLRLGEREPDAMTSSVVDEFGGVMSPDGRRLAFYSYPEGTGDAPGVPRGVIWVMPLDGGPAQRVNSSATYGIFPEWSPDGTRLEWFCGQQRLCVATQDGAGRWHVDVSTVIRSNWSPDGRWSASRMRAGGGPGGGLSGGGGRGGGGGRDSVWIYPREAGAARLLYARREPTDPLPSELHWAADSRSLIFKQLDRDGVATFWSLSIDGGAPRLVARLDDPARPSLRPAFATDGRRIYFSVNDRQSDISVVELIVR